MLVDLYKDKFSQAGFEVITAFDGEEGLKLAKTEKPDLIILDILLPRENGISFLKEQKKDPEISEISVVALSNYDNPETKRRPLSLALRIIY